MTKILVLGAHPDDETLGLGGTLSLHSKKGDKIFVLVFTEGESARGSKSNISKRRKQAERAAKILGIYKIEFLNYQDQKLDVVSTLELAQEIEKVIKKWNPTIIFTHFGGDINQDHKKIFEATTIAARPLPKSKIQQVICYETPSSTELSNSPRRFEPNFFVDISNSIKTKIKALKQYKNEIKPYPHPRSEEAIMNRASFWGTSVGKKYAEAFFMLRLIK